MRTIEVVFFDAGAGHRSAANALCATAKQRSLPLDLRMMNLQELLDETDLFRKVTGFRLEDCYNLMLRKGWTLGSAQMMVPMHALIKIFRGAHVKLLEKHWATDKPDMVVSVVPNFNRALCDGVRSALPGVPFVTILTDIADYPPHFWIEKQEQYLICGSIRAREQALALGHSPDRVFLTSGMILNPRFYDPVEVDRERDRAALGLDPDLPVALMMFGGEGSMRMLEIFDRLDQSDIPMQMIAVCGKNQRLESSLRTKQRRMPLRVEGFTRDIPRLMALSDFFIGKPGPGSISEAIAMKLPVIVETNAWTLPQERYNRTWVEENKVGITVDNLRKEIVPAVRRMLDPTVRAEFGHNVARLKNRAVFEILEILQQIQTAHSN